MKKLKTYLNFNFNVDEEMFNDLDFNFKIEQKTIKKKVKINIIEKKKDASINKKLF